jgi:hypothetical protein
VKGLEDKGGRSSVEYTGLDNTLGLCGSDHVIDKGSPILGYCAVMSLPRPPVVDVIPKQIILHQLLPEIL